jgi:PAS domain S-box-containing protein
VHASDDDHTTLALGTYVGAGVMILLAMVRQIVSVVDNARLNARLRRAVRDLDVSHQSLQSALVEVKKSERRFQLMADTTPAIIWTVNADMRPDWVSKRLADLTGLPQEQIVADGWRSVIHPDDFEKALGVLREAFAARRVHRDEYRVRRADGEYVWLMSTGLPRFDESGEFAGFIGSCIDITERREAEQALRESEERYRLISSASNDVIWEWDPSHNRLTRSDMMFSVFRLAPQQIEPTFDWWLAQIHDEDRERIVQSIRDAVHDTAAATWQGEYRFRCGDGEFADVLDRCCIERDERGRAVRVIGAMQDVTARKRMESLEAERNNLRGAVKALDRVLGVVGHELRTPLAAMRAMTELMLIDPASVDAKSYTQTVHDQLVQMSELVNDILEVARLNSGTAMWNWGDVSVKQACEAAAASMRLLLKPGVALGSNVTPAELAMRGDAEAIRRLVVNLLSNSAKATSDGHINVTADRVLDEHDLSQVRLIVEDTGCGMPSEVAAKIGEAFALNSGIVGIDHGSGLGLAICKGIVAAHGGTLVITSSPNKGTKVTIHLRADLSEPVRTIPKLNISYRSAA